MDPTFIPCICFITFTDVVYAGPSVCVLSVYATTNRPNFVDILSHFVQYPPPPKQRWRCMDNTKWAWPIANQQTIEECELVFYALVALYDHYTTVGVPRFRKARQCFLTKLDAVVSLEGLYTLDRRPNGNYWEAIAIATHACCPDFENLNIRVSQGHIGELGFHISLRGLKTKTPVPSYYYGDARSLHCGRGFTVYTP